MRYSYYPGCSLHSSAREYDESTRAVCKALGIELVELPDWNCCGATSAHSLNDLLAVAIPARNLKIAEGLGLDLVTPCAACFNRLKDAEHIVGENPKIIEEVINYSFRHNIKVLHLLDIMDLSEIKKRLVKPLNGLKLVAYYGCLLVRPPKVTEFDNLENPVKLDKLLETIGATTLDWSYKTECCGASLSLTRRDIVYNLVSKIVNSAKDSGASAIVTACPLCQANLEMRQKENFPIFYFTELLGIVFGLEESEEWLKRHLVNVQALLQ